MDSTGASPESGLIGNTVKRVRYTLRRFVLHYQDQPGPLNALKITIDPAV